MHKKHYKRIQLADSSPEWNISECSSSSSDEEQPASGRHRAVASPLFIENCSSDEENTNHSPSRSFLHNQYNKRSNSAQCIKPTSASRRVPLPIASRKRKSSDAAGTSTVRRILGNRNSDLENSPQKATSQHNATLTATYSVQQISPGEVPGAAWCKVRKTFVPLKKQTSDICAEAAVSAEMPTAADLDETRIDWSSSSSSEPSTPTAVDKRPTRTPACTQLSTAPTELDLLVALIERECNTPKLTTSQLKSKRSSRFKRCQRGGYLQELQHALAAAHAEQMFLEHDQQLNIQHGVKLRVLQLEQQFGVHFAKVQIDSELEDEEVEDGDSFYVVVEAHMAVGLQIGSKLEAFFDVNSEKYDIEAVDNGTNRMGAKVFVQPYKLLLCK